MAASNQTIRVLLLGKTGSGKSSLGNMFFGEKHFLVRRGMSSGTEKCNYSEGKVNDHQLQITDTPGLCDTHRSEEDIILEVGKSVATCAPGPHIILIVCRCDKRFDKAEYRAYRSLQKLFGEEIRSFMVVVFAGVDVIEPNPERQQIALIEELRNNPSDVRTVVQDAGGRIFAVNNNATGGQRQRQATQLLELMLALYNKNGKRYFSNRMCEDIDRQVDALVDNRMQKDKIDRQTAEYIIRMNIVEEKLGREFVHKIIMLVECGFPLDHAVEVSMMCNQM